MSKSLVWQDWINEALDEYEFAKESFENSYNDKRYKFYHNVAEDSHLYRWGMNATSTEFT